MLLKKSIISFLLIFTMFSIIGCSQETTTTAGLDYSDFDYISDYSEVFNRREGDYLVYVYQDTCAACLRLKTDFLNFANTYEDYQIYFYNVGKNSDTTNQAEYLSIIGQTQVSTPVLLVVKNKSFDNTNVSRYYFAGETKIRAMMTDLEKDSYPYWD